MRGRQAGLMKLAALRRECWPHNQTRAFERWKRSTAQPGVARPWRAAPGWRCV